MSARLFRRRRDSSISQNTQLPDGPPPTMLSDDERVEARYIRSSSITPIARRHRSASVNSAVAPGLSSSYNLPSRSYIHHAGRGSEEPVQYSSSGVRAQTLELSTSFISDSEMTGSTDDDIIRRRSISDRGWESPSRRHETIAEQSEPVTPDGRVILPPPAATDLVDALNPQSLSGAASSPSSKSNERQGNIPEIVVVGETPGDVDECTSLLPRPRLSSKRSPAYGTTPRDFIHQQQPLKDLRDDTPDVRFESGHQYPSLRARTKRAYDIISQPKSWDLAKVCQVTILHPIAMLPSVFLGVLLNLLDALSYGIILFPLGEEVFADMGPDGVSMFYVSCIISQLVYSSGSIFKGGVGSEMIEVVPFFHKMTYMIMAKMGTSNPDALRATVITSYAMSSIITGVVFLGLGAARLGTLVNFFPHSILTGCIGGVGIFLFVTGVEVSARLDGNLDFSIDTLRQLFTPDTIQLWLPPLVLAVALLTIKHFYDRPWLVPAYYIAITAIFYIVTTAIPSITMDGLRNNGWVFEAPAAGVPFYNFYSYYKFGLVDWEAVWMTIPSQLALTFFGILHVPINVPNLAMVVQEDNVSINRELIMHGISNTLSGAVGSIQNYLVFVNSVLFMNTGANSRLAGYMLAAATAALWIAGPIVIGYVPVMVVGTLIYMLGIDLAIEALVATWGRLQSLEYFTIVVIAIVMGIYDFVVGIALGIGLACLVYVVQTSRKTVIRAEFSGTVAESTVRRHPRQRNYLHRVGNQIRVVKLGGYLFFGSIVKVEKKIRTLIDAEAFAANPIRYLIVDLSHVTGIDFSAAEAFARMNRILHRRQVHLALASVTLGSDVGKGLQMVGLFVEDEAEDGVPVPKVFEDLNGALESCENEMLLVLTEKQRTSHDKPLDSPPIAIPERSPDLSQISHFERSIGSPRRNHLNQAATNAIRESGPADSFRWQSLKQPLPLILQAFQDVTDRTEDFWFRLLPHLLRREYTRGQALYSRGDTPDGFYILQSGVLRAEYFLEQGSYHESIVAGTTCGELPFFSETSRTSRVYAESDCVAWLLTAERWRQLQKEDSEIAQELLKVGLKLSAERMNAIVSHVLITAS